MSAKLVKLDRAYWPQGGFGHWCPGCNYGHEINIEAENGEPKWSFDGNAQAPTFKPSVHIQTNRPNHRHYNADAKSSVCHYFITAGKVIFQNDCTHALKGQTVDLPDVPDDKYRSCERLV